MEEIRGRSNHKRQKVTWIILTADRAFFERPHGHCHTLSDYFSLNWARLLVWRLLWLIPAPFSSHLLLELKSMFQAFHPLCRLSRPEKSQSGPTRLMFPSSAPTEDSITDLDPLGMDNPGLKRTDSVINMSDGCDHCSLAVMPFVELREHWWAGKRDPYNYALAQQGSPPGKHRQSLTGPLLATRGARHILRNKATIARVIHTLSEWFAALLKMWTLFVCIKYIICIYHPHSDSLILMRI